MAGHAGRASRAWPGTRTAAEGEPPEHADRSARASRPRDTCYLPLSEDEDEPVELDPLAAEEEPSLVPEFEPDAVLSPEDES